MQRRGALVKRVKRSGKVEEPNVTQPRGKAWLTDLPLDILLEVFWYSTPLDLLHLARTTKGFRAFLLNRRQSRPHWVNAFREFEDDPCPPFLSEPAYANLLFKPLCNGCSAPCDMVLWELRMRCCSFCLPLMTRSASGVGTEFANLVKPYRPFDCLPLVTRVQHQTTRDGVDVHYTDIKPVASVADMQDLKASLEESKITGKRKVLVDKFRQFKRDTSAFAVSLRQRSIKLGQLTDKRRNDIIDRLRKAGWAEELSFMDTSAKSDFGQLEVVRMARQVTSVEWESIHPTLVKWMTEQKNRRLEKVAKRTLADRLSLLSKVVYSYSARSHPTLSNILPLPRPVDVAMFPHVREVLEVDHKTRLTAKGLSHKLDPVLPDMMKKWSECVRSRLQDLACEWYGLNGDEDPSQHFAAYVYCRRCLTHMSLRDAVNNIRHPCLYPTAEDSWVDILQDSHRKKHTAQKGTMSYDVVVQSWYTCLPWDVGCLERSFVTDRINNLVETLGYDTSNIDWMAVAASPTRVTCNGCRSSRRAPMDAGVAWRHCISRHLNALSEVTFCVLPDETATRKRGSSPSIK